MKLLWYFDRIKEKLIRWYRKEVFRETVYCPHNGFTLVVGVPCKKMKMRS